MYLANFQTSVSPLINIQLGKEKMHDDYFSTLHLKYAHLFK